MKNILIKLVIIICFWIFISQFRLLGQTKNVPLFEYKSAALFEYEGFGGFSIRHERFFWQKNRNRIALSLGFSAYLQKLPLPYPIENEIYRYGIPFNIFYTIASKSLKSHLEAGVGYHFLSQDAIGGKYYIASQGGVPPLDSTYRYKIYKHVSFVKIGYRWQKPRGGFLFKVGYYPFSFQYFILKYPDFSPSGYIGVGWSF